MSLLSDNAKDHTGIIRKAIPDQCRLSSQVGNATCDPGRLLTSPMLGELCCRRRLSFFRLLPSSPVISPWEEDFVFGVKAARNRAPDHLSVSCGFLLYARSLDGKCCDVAEHLACHTAQCFGNLSIFGAVRDAFWVNIYPLRQEFQYRYPTRFCRVTNRFVPRRPKLTEFDEFYGPKINKC